MKATFGDQGGYNAYFIVSAALGLVGVLVLVVYARLNAKEKETKKVLNAATEM